MSSWYVQQRLLLVGEWASVKLSKHVVFPASSRREVILSSSRGHCWMRTGFFLGTSKSVSGMRRFPIPSKVSGNSNTFVFIYFLSFLLISTDEVSFKRHFFSQKSEDVLFTVLFLCLFSTNNHFVNLTYKMKVQVNNLNTF